jgi:hypothetical protein
MGIGVGGAGEDEIVVFVQAVPVGDVEHAVADPVVQAELREEEAECRAERDVLQVERDRRLERLVGVLEPARGDVDRDRLPLGVLGLLLDVLEDVLEGRLVGEGHRDRLL